MTRVVQNILAREFFFGRRMRKTGSRSCTTKRGPLVPIARALPGSLLRLLGAPHAVLPLK
jgi:hypothetical protein